MGGFELIGFVSFFKQIGLAVAGASTFWGLIFTLYADKHEKTVDGVVYRFIAYRLFWFLALATIITTIGWIATSTLISAHEGIILIPTPTEIISAFNLVEPIFLIWISLVAVATAIRLFKKELFDKLLPHLFLINFVLIFTLISLPAWTGLINDRQLFFIGHGFHSIFTLGTVIVLDVLFLSSKNSLLLKQKLFPFFPIISKVIWVGLAFDFLSVALVFDEAIRLTPRFFFAQTVIGVLVINGALLSGPLTKMMLKTVARNGQPLSKKQTLWADIAGTISITSWLSIYFVDLFHNLTLNYYQLLGGYITVMIILFTGHHLWEKFDNKKHLPPQILA